jgi:precorrin-6A synthase
MKQLRVVGIGIGDPDQVTVQAIRALADADVLITMDKTAGRDGLDDLLALRRGVLDRHLSEPYHLVTATDPARVLDGPSYRDDVERWHEARAGIVEALIANEVPDGGSAAFPVWGDPALYDSTLRILDRIASRSTTAIAVSAVPGIGAPQALAARFGIPLHRVGAPVLVTTGRRLRDGWPAGVDDVVVMLDSSCTFGRLDPAGVTIHWGAYLGTDHEILISGPLGEVADEIVRVRAEARAARGWLFDTYLLQR